MSVTTHKFEDRGELLDVLYNRILVDLDSALNRQDEVTLLLSGGSTPAPLYRKLSGAELDWSRINVALVDERWVDSQSPASNERFVAENLIQDKAASAHFIGMKNNHPSPQSGENECNQLYSGISRPYHLCLLGMGPDGHTASLFPGAQGLAEALDKQQPCAAITALPSEVTGEFVERMTMTPWSILQSRQLILLIIGESKWEVFQQAQQKGASEKLPISFLIHQNQVELEVYWAP